MARLRLRASRAPAPRVAFLFSLPVLVPYWARWGTHDRGVASEGSQQREKGTIKGRKQILLALVSLGTPLAASAASTPATALEVEAQMRSGQLALGSAAPTPDLSQRIHELVVNGASYNEAPVKAAQERESARAATASLAHPRRG